MAKITRTIDVPFDGCDKCRYLELEERVVYADGYAYVELNRCRNENICINAVKTAEKGKEGQI